MSSDEPNRHRVTLADVARVAGVSPATVSRSLAGDGQISERTRQRVVRAATQLGYVPNAAARSLALRQTAILALLIPDLSDPVYGQVSAGFEQVASQHQLQVILANTGTKPAQERETFEAVMAHRPSGITLLGSVLDQDEVRRTLGPTPCVFVHPEKLSLAGHESEPSRGCIRIDETDGMRQVVAHLAERGYRRIAFAAGPNVASNVKRRDALLAEAKSADIDTTVIDTSEHWLSVDAMARAIVRADVQAVVCYDDRLALGVMDGLRRHGVDVPGEIGVVGFDDMPFAGLAHPRLTTVAQPSAEIGRTAATMLKQALTDGAVPDSRLIAVSLVVRDSTPARRRVRARGGRKSARPA